MQHYPSSEGLSTEFWSCKNGFLRLLPASQVQNKHENKEGGWLLLWVLYFIHASHVTYNIQNNKHREKLQP